MESIELTNQNDFTIIGTPKAVQTFVYAIRIGIIGYGRLGQYLVEQLLQDGQKYRLDLAFIWNRTALTEEQRSKILIRCPLVKFLEAPEQIKDIDVVDLIVEVCDPLIVQQYAELFLDKADFLLGSPTALADENFSKKLFEKLSNCPHRMFIARGALWGANDIQMMSRRERLNSVDITMRFHPRALRLLDPEIKKLNDDLLKNFENKFNNTNNNNKTNTNSGTGGSTGGDGDGGTTIDQSIILYEGPARELCLLAPNNVNTIAIASIIGLGFDQTIGRLISDLNLIDYHQIDIKICGKPLIDGKQFSIDLKRLSPIQNSHNVSSLQTFNSFWHSILQCTGSYLRTKNFELKIC